LAALPSLDVITIAPLEVLLEEPNPFPSEALHTLEEAKMMSDRNSTDEFRRKLGHSPLSVTLLRDAANRRTTPWHEIGRQEILHYILPVGTHN
jgi:hypothetical protein